MATTNIRQTRVTVLTALALGTLAVLAGCDTSDAPLLGDREALSNFAAPVSEAENVARPISLPPVTTNSSWTHPGSNALHRMANAAFSDAPSVAWSARIGSGDGRKQRINARPVIADGRIFTVDAAGMVAATSTAGERLWTANLTPSTERAGQGGSHGLAYGGGAVYVNTGFGEVVALDPATGGELWDQDIDAQGGGSATYFDGRVYVAARDSVGWAINAETGRVDWQLTGTPSGSSYLGGAGPAVSDDLAIFPFPSGELLAVFRRGGVQRWTATVLGGRDGVAYAQVSDLAADPVIAGGRVYASNPAGRLVALGLNNGARQWTALEGALEAPVVAGDGVFLVSDQNALLRLDANTGERVWARQLSLFEESRARRQKTVFTHRGPVLAGGRLWLASSEGTLSAYDPVNGAELAAVPIPGGAATAPVVAGGTMYVVSKRGQLIAFR